MAKPKNEVHKGEKAFELHKNIGKNEGLRRILLVKNIALLVDMYDEEYYKDILGDEEARNGTVSVRARSGSQKNGVPLEDFVVDIFAEISNRERVLSIVD